MTATHKLNGGVWRIAGVCCLLLSVEPLRIGAQDGFTNRMSPQDMEGGRRGGPESEPEKAILAIYDSNGDGWLNASERAKARVALKAAVSTSGGRRRGRPGGGVDETQQTPEAGLALTPGDVKSYPGAPFYDQGVIRTLFMTFESADWEEELEDFHNTDVKVPATLVVDGKTYPNVGVKFRGNSSYDMVQRGSKRSFGLTMDYVVSKQNIDGYRNLTLLNSNGDASMMRVVLSREIGQHYLPMPKANWVRVVVNGESWGLYVNQQKQDKVFLKEHFGTKKGSRWKVPGSPNGRGSLNDMGDDLEVYREIFEIKSKESLGAWASLMLLCKTLEDAAPDKAQSKPGSLLDIDGALRFLAFDNVLANSDGYWTRASDYMLYLSPQGVFHVLPYDYNETLLEETGGGPGGGRGGPPMMMGGESRGSRGGDRGGPPMNAAGGPGGGGGHESGSPTLDPLISAERADRPLASRLLAVPELRTRYLQYVHEIADKFLDPDVLGASITRYDKLIDADLWDDTRKLEGYESYLEQVDLDPAADGILGFAAKRRAFLLEHKAVKAAQAKK